jgi:hypothetical protein
MQHIYEGEIGKRKRANGKKKTGEWEKENGRMGKRKRANAIRPYREMLCQLLTINY